MNRRCRLFWDSCLTPPSTRSLSAGVALEISHGYRILDRNDAYVEEADAFGENFADATLPNNYVVDWLPFRKTLSVFLLRAL